MTSDDDVDKKWPQILAIFIANLSSLTFGMMQGWTSPYILKIAKDKTHYDISEEEAAYLTMIPAISMVATCLFFSKLNDIIGRKFTLMLIAIPYLICLILTIVATSIEIFYLSRVFQGLGDTFYFVSLLMYTAEISTPRVRGTWGTLIMIMMFLGMFLINTIGSFLNVVEGAYCYLPIIFVFLLLMLAIPESPYFYIMKGQTELAKKSLRFFRGKENIEREYVELKADVERQVSETGSWLDLFKISANRNALIAGIFLRLSQQFSGSMVFNSFAQFIFEKAGTNISSETSSIIYSGLLFLATVFCAYSIEKFGRKKNHMYSLLCCGVVLLLLAVYFYMDQNMGIKKFQWFPLVGMVLYIVSSSCGVAVIPNLMLGELFSASIKPKALSFLTITTGLMIFVTNQIFYLLYNNYGLFSPFLMFSLCCFVSTMLSVKLVPETKGNTLEEIQQILRRRRVT